MGSIGEFLAMGGHGGYIWSAYGIAVVVIGGLVITSLRAVKAREAEAAALEAARPSRRRRRRTGSGDDA